MQYDPVKQKIGKIVGSSLFMRKVFYRLLDILLLRTWHVKKAIRQYAKTAPPQASVLDAGSGFGQYTYRMHRIESSWTIKGIDLKKEQVNDCNDFFAGIQSSNVSFEYADLTTFKSPSAFSLILSVDVMEHIENDTAVFQNFYQSLQKNGWLIISTPSDKGGSDVHHHDDKSFIDEHVRDGYSIEDIERKLSVAGFNQITSKYTYGIAGKLSWLLSMKIPIIMLNASWLLALLLPVWYILVLPFSLFLNYIDTVGTNREGTGLLVIAKKNPE